MNLRNVGGKLNILKWRWRFRVLALVVVAGLIGSGVYWRQTTTKQAQEQIQTAVVERGDLTNSLTLSGQIEQSNVISVFTKASGVVSKVYVTDGQEVKAGDKLAEITLDSEGLNNQSSAWASYLSAKNSSMQAEASKLNNQASMFSKWDTYMDKTEEEDFKDTNSTYRDLPEFQILQKEWLASEITYKAQDTAISASQASLSHAWYNYQLYQATITAPVDGTIIGFNLAEGLTVAGSQNSSGGAVSQTVASIKTVGNPVASFTATEVDINEIEVGQTATLVLDSLVDQEFKGTVVSVDRVGTVNNGVTQYTVLMQFAESDDKILTNMALTAEILLDSREDVLAVPVSAVKSMGENKMVMVLKNGKPQPVQVETGLETDTQVEIVSGLKEGEEIVIGNGTAISSSGSSEDRPSAGFSMGGGMMGGGPPR